MRPFRHLVAALAVTWSGLLPSPAEAKLYFYWEADFPAETRTELQDWLRDAFEALEEHVGVLPLPVHVHIHRRSPADEPVPWASTRRGKRQGVDFYVDPRYAAGRFRADWTAAHEFSHLVLPYLGREHAWFAEGFASYMQYRVMQTQGVLSAEEVQARYRRNIERARRAYDLPQRSFVAAAPRLCEEGRYPTMYWGGAVYFQRVERRLQADGNSLQSVLQRYLRCCRRNAGEIDQLVATLDRLAGSTAFRDTLARFRQTPGFPAQE